MASKPAALPCTHRLDRKRNVARVFSQVSVLFLLEGIDHLLGGKPMGGD